MLDPCSDSSGLVTINCNLEHNLDWPTTIGDYIWIFSVCSSLKATVKPEASDFFTEGDVKVLEVN